MGTVATLELQGSEFSSVINLPVLFHLPNFCKHSHNKKNCRWCGKVKVIQQLSGFGCTNSYIVKLKKHDGLKLFLVCDYLQPRTARTAGHPGLSGQNAQSHVGQALSREAGHVMRPATPVVVLLSRRAHVAWLNVTVEVRK